MVYSFLWFHLPLNRWPVGRLIQIWSNLKISLNFSKLLKWQFTIIYKPVSSGLNVICFQRYTSSNPCCLIESFDVGYLILWCLECVPYGLGWMCVRRAIWNDNRQKTQQVYRTHFIDVILSNDQTQMKFYDIPRCYLKRPINVSFDYMILTSETCGFFFK